LTDAVPGGGPLVEVTQMTNSASRMLEWIGVIVVDELDGHRVRQCLDGPAGDQDDSGLRWVGVRAARRDAVAVALRHV
jgi:hypothetical protein